MMARAKQRRHLERRWLIKIHEIGLLLRQGVSPINENRVNPDVRQPAGEGLLRSPGMRERCKGMRATADL